MTDNEIIKALEYCSQQGVTSECERCKVKKGCRSELIVNALDLINRQKAEFAEELIYKIVNTPTKFESTYYMYREGVAFRQNEIIDIIKEMVGDDK